MLPIGTESVILRSPRAVYVLIGVTALAFLATWVGQSDASFMQTASAYGAGRRALGYVTHLFLHVGWEHLIGNMWVLAVFGVIVCGRVGWGYFLGAYLAVGIVGGLVHGVFSTSAGVGASGAVNGIIGIYLVLAPRTRVHLLIGWGVARIRSWMIVALWFAFDLYGAVDGSGGVAYGAHIGGLLAGFGLGLMAVRTGIAPLVPEELTLPEIMDWRWALPTTASEPATPRRPLAPASPRRGARVTAPSAPAPLAEGTPTTARAPSPRPARAVPAAPAAPGPDGPGLAMVTLTCACGWSVEGPALFMGDGVNCRRCKTWLPMRTPGA